VNDVLITVSECCQYNAAAAASEDVNCKVWRTGWPADHRDCHYGHLKFNVPHSTQQVTSLVKCMYLST